MEKKKKSVAGQFAVKCRAETQRRTQKLNREDYGVDKYWVLLAVVKEYTLWKNNKHKLCSLDQFSLLRFEISLVRLRFSAG